MKRQARPWHLLDGFRGYQFEAVKWMNANNGVGLIGDPMGAGKTLEAIGYHVVNPGITRPILVICPAIAKYNWEDEILTWTKDSVFVINGRIPSRLPDVDWYVINYDILVNKKVKEGVKYKLYGWVQSLMKLPFKSIIIDEAHYIANLSTNRTMGARLLAREKESRILITGTPMTKNPGDFFQILNILNPDTFVNSDAFKRKYMHRVNEGNGFEFKGAKNLDALHEEVKPYMIRREKHIILPELPPKNKIIKYLPVSMSHLANYQKDEQALKDWAISIIGKNSDISFKGGAHIAKLKQLAYLAKRDMVFEWIDQFFQEEDKLVVFLWHRNAIHDMYSRYKDKAVAVYGGIGSKESLNRAKVFQKNPDCRLFIGQIRSAGEVITLTSAHNLAFAELAQTPTQHEQAADRVHRYGQNNQVNIYYLLAKDTIEERIVKYMENTSKNISKAVDGRNDSFLDNSDWEKSLVYDVLRSYGAQI